MSVSIRVLAPAAAGSCYLYHSNIGPSGETQEHFFIGRIRRQVGGSTLLYCHLCDAVTSIPASESNSDHRAVEALLARAPTTDVLLLASTQTLDPLQAAKDDG